MSSEAAAAGIDGEAGLGRAIGVAQFIGKMVYHGYQQGVQEAAA